MSTFVMLYGSRFEYGVTVESGVRWTSGIANLCIGYDLHGSDIKCCNWLGLMHLFLGIYLILRTTYVYRCENLHEVDGDTEY